MKFWDSSALVPLVVDETTTPLLTAIAAVDAEILVSPITTVEVESALWRKARHMRDGGARQRSHQRLAALRDQWTVIEEFHEILEEARRMVARHGLRGADAIQLASAIVARGETVLTLVTRDEDLATAARAEGFPVLP